MMDKERYDVLVEQLHACARKWRDCCLEIGQVLLELKNDGQPVGCYFDMLSGYGMTKATCEVAIRWAAGELGENAELMVSKINHSVLSKLSKEAIETIVQDKYVIRIPGEGRVAEKSFLEMNRKEVNANIDAKGFIPIARATTDEPIFRYCIATSIEHGKNRKVFLIARVMGKNPIRMELPKKLLLQLVGLADSGDGGAEPMVEVA